jgi:anthranilate synthase/aminodeoxychorismate synthase-like glutamine amidotransferase
MILIIDNYDSFVYNIDRYLRRLGQPTTVVRNDAMTAAEVLANNYSAIVISPGPQTPDEAGYSLEIIKRCAPSIPILGVCLGHQAIGQAYGAKVVRASRPVHGQASLIEHQGTDLFHGLPSPLSVARYHSLVIDPESLPNSLQVLATCEGEIIMAVRHREFAVWGVQFHPESIMTEGGYRMLANFLKLNGLAGTNELPDSDLVPGAATNIKISKSVEPWDEVPWWELP